MDTFYQGMDSPASKYVRNFESLPYVNRFRAERAKESRFDSSDESCDDDNRIQLQIENISHVNLSDRDGGFNTPRAGKVQKDKKTHLYYKP